MTAPAGPARSPAVGLTGRSICGAVGAVIEERMAELDPERLWKRCAVVRSRLRRYHARGCPLPDERIDADAAGDAEIQADRAASSPGSGMPAAAFPD